MCGGGGCALCCGSVSSVHFFFYFMDPKFINRAQPVYVVNAPCSTALTEDKLSSIMDVLDLRIKATEAELNRLCSITQGITDTHLPAWSGKLENDISVLAGKIAQLSKQLEENEKIMSETRVEIAEISYDYGEFKNAILEDIQMNDGEKKEVVE